MTSLEINNNNAFDEAKTAHNLSFSVPQRPRNHSRCHASSDSFRSMALKCLIRRLNICLEAAIYFILYFCIFVVFFLLKHVNYRYV